MPSQRQDVLLFIMEHSQFTQEEQEVGYIYLVREREFIRTGEQVYKFGRTVQRTGTVHIGRLDSYKKGTELLFLWQCIKAEDVPRIESLIKAAFVKNFKPHRDGHEYFEGDRFQMISVITSITCAYDQQQLKLCSAKTTEGHENQVLSVATFVRAYVEKMLQGGITTQKRAFFRKFRSWCNENNLTSCNSQNMLQDATEELIREYEKKVNELFVEMTERVMNSEDFRDIEQNLKDNKAVIGQLKRIYAMV